MKWTHLLTSHLDMEDEIILPDVANKDDTHAVANEDIGVESPNEDVNALEPPEDVLRS